MELGSLADKIKAPSLKKAKINDCNLIHSAVLKELIINTAAPSFLVDEVRSVVPAETLDRWIAEARRIEQKIGAPSNPSEREESHAKSDTEPARSWNNVRLLQEICDVCV